MFWCPSSRNIPKSSCLWEKRWNYPLAIRTILSHPRNCALYRLRWITSAAIEENSLAINLSKEIVDEKEGIMLSYPIVISMVGQIAQLVELIQAKCDRIQKAILYPIFIATFTAN